MIDYLKYVLGGEDYDTSNGIHIHNPTIEEIKNFGSQRYSVLLYKLTMRSYDDAVALWDVGLDYEDIPDFLTFVNNIQKITPDESKILFGDLDLSKFVLDVNKTNLEPVIKNGNLIIDSLIYNEIVSYLRDINNISSEIEYKVGNKKAKEFLISRMRRKQQKMDNKSKVDLLSNLISALVNRENFKYDYSSIMNLKISQLYDSFYRIIKIDEYKNHVMGLYCNPMAFNKVEKSVLKWYGSNEEE